MIIILKSIAAVLIPFAYIAIGGLILEHFDQNPSHANQSTHKQSTPTDLPKALTRWPFIITVAISTGMIIMLIILLATAIGL
ncbi:hypothetical protein [Lacticaseibacillus paracasei]|uniref:hypothetical protein n=1 Tax=Lacticaseibacillus paracasei TaxID=1597 RepID=UPI003DA8E8E0